MLEYFRLFRKNWWIFLLVVFYLGSELTACSPIEDPTHTNTMTHTSEVNQFIETLAEPSSTEPVIPKETTTLTPTSTSKPSPYDQSVLSSSQKELLYQASLAYVAKTHKDAVKVAQNLAFNKKYSHPSTMCGPLAVAILRDAGLLEKYIDIHAFWLLNPHDEYTVKSILEIYFPRDKFLWYQTTIPLQKFDFKKFPLYPGDFLYIYAGSLGTFDHMLTVTRIDEEGRAYTVTNHNTENDGYLISEKMLYDPNNPEDGFFYELTNFTNRKIGITGFGGFQLWRPLYPVPKLISEDIKFGECLDNIFIKYGGDWHVLVKEIGGRVIYSRLIKDKIHPASIIKVPIAMLFFKALEQQPDDLGTYLSKHGSEGRSFEQLLRALLVISEEDAADVMKNWLNDHLRVSDVLKDWGANHTTIDPRRTTVQDITLLFEGLYQGKWLTPEARETILDLLSEYTLNDDTRLGVIREELSTGSKLYSKRGSLTTGRVIAAEVAIVENKGKAFLVAIFGYPGNQEPYASYKDLNAAIEDAALVILDYINQYHW